MENNKKYLDYIKKKHKISVPELQAKFNLSYKEARAFLREAEQNKMVEFDGSLYFSYSKCKTSKRKKDAKTNRKKGLEFSKEDAIRKMEEMSHIFTQYVSQTSEIMNKNKSEENNVISSGDNQSDDDIDFECSLEELLKCDDLDDDDLDFEGDETIDEKFDFNSNEEFENICMDIIEKIVAISPTQTRVEAIKVAEQLHENSLIKKDFKLLRFYKRVILEFQKASDEEYELLRKHIFRN